MGFQVSTDDCSAIRELDDLLADGLLHETHHEAFNLLVDMGEGS